jgi:hypothetical protein
MNNFKRLPALAESIKALAVVFFLVLVFLAFGKFGVLPINVANAWIEGTILAFGALILFLETFKEGFKLFSFSLILAVITISSTFLLAYSKFSGYQLMFLSGFTEGAVYIAIAGLLVYELILESTGKKGLKKLW